MADEAKITSASAAEIGDSESPGDEEGGRDGTVQSGALLPASRRVDWRFLLPDPLLGDVICVGPVTQALADSLQIFSVSLANLKPDDSGDEHGGAPLYDVAVASNPSRLAMSHMASLVKPGGFVYLEAHGLTSLLRRSQRPTRWQDFRQRGLWPPRRYARVLQALGFKGIQVHWHWPDFENCKMIIPLIPLDSPAAARFAFARSGPDMSARLRARVGQLLGWSGLLARTVPCFSVLARRSMS